MCVWLSIGMISYDDVYGVHATWSDFCGYGFSALLHSNTTTQPQLLVHANVAYLDNDIYFLAHEVSSFLNKVFYNRLQW